jgi:hypothetical protein
MNEHRKAVRALTHLAGRVALDGTSPETLPCLVRNLSPIGARVVFCAEVEIPDSFDLFLGPGKTAYRVRRIWSAQNEVGVLFSEARRNAPDVLCDAAPSDEDPECDGSGDDDPDAGAAPKF